MGYFPLYFQGYWILVSSPYTSLPRILYIPVNVNTKQLRIIKKVAPERRTSIFQKSQEFILDAGVDFSPKIIANCCAEGVLLLH